MKNLKMTGVVFALMLGLSVPVQAHEFIVRVDPPAPATGAQTRASFMASHVFTESDEMEDPANVKASLIQNEKSTVLALKPDPAAKSLATEFTVTAKGPAWLAAHRLPQLWSQTPDGMMAGDKTTLSDKKVLSTTQYEKFVKVLLNPAAADKSFSQPIGQTLEVVPLENPAGLKVGDEIKVRVLYNGNPVAVPVYASYMGFSDQPNTYAYYTEPEAGDAVVKVTAKGMWLIRANYKAPGSGDIKTHDLKAILQFMVN